MKNKIVVFLSILLIIGSASIVSCKKSSPSTVAAPVYPVSFYLNNTFYSCEYNFLVDLYNSWFNIDRPITLLSDFDMSINPNGSYIAFTYTDDTSTYAHSYKGYCHGFTFAPLNLAVDVNQSFDTTGCVINVFSSNTSAIVPGTYKIYPDTFTVSAPPNAGIIFATARGISTTMRRSGFKDSTCIGTLTITQMNMPAKIASGTFDFVNYGKSINGTVPSIIISQGQFTAISLQEY